MAAQEIRRTTRTLVPRGRDKSQPHASMAVHDGRFCEQPRSSCHEASAALVLLSLCRSREHKLTARPGSVRVDLYVLPGNIGYLRSIRRAHTSRCTRALCRLISEATPAGRTMPESKRW